MRINTSIGEASALIGQCEYSVRPSFAALASIGDPEAIDTVIRGCVRALETLESEAVPSVTNLCCCSSMLTACSDIPEEVMGWAEGETRLLWRQRLVSINDLVVMANHCVKWGVMGDPRRKLTDKKKAKAKGLFDPQEFVAVLIDEWNMSSQDAWNTTLVEFQRLCEARHKKAWGDKPEPPTLEEAKASVEWAKQVRERARTEGIKRKRGSSRRTRK
jgi:hypothetical protein